MRDDPDNLDAIDPPHPDILPPDDPAADDVRAGHHNHRSRLDLLRIAYKQVSDALRLDPPRTPIGSASRL